MRSIQKIAIFGSKGTLGRAFYEQLAPRYDVTRFSRYDLQFDKEITGLDACLGKDFDFIFNCVGKFGTNSQEWSTLFEANYGSCWLMIKHYIDNPPQKPISLIFMGSTSHNGPRRNYMNYAASKAALASLVCSAQEYFEDTPVTVELLELRKFKSTMNNNCDPLLPTALTIVKDVLKTYQLG